MRGSEFAELKAFAAVVDQGNFGRAARQLGISPSALSQTIRQLEKRLGVRLLNRTTRSVAPTVSGERLHARLLPMLRELEAAVAEAVSATGRAAGPLRINAPHSAVQMLIAPRCGPFLQAHPEVTLDLVVDDGISDIVAGRFDAGIRIGERLDKDMIAVRLTPDLQLFAVASPDYLARHGTPQTPADLHDHRCIRWRNPGGTIYRWEFEKDGKSMEMNVEGPLVSTDLQLILDAALQGLGIAYTHDIRLDKWISEGRLIRILADWSPQFPGLFLYYPSRRHPQPALRAFIDCLLDRP